MILPTSKVLYAYPTLRVHTVSSCIVSLLPLRHRRPITLSPSPPLPSLSIPYGSARITLSNATSAAAFAGNALRKAGKNPLQNVRTPPSL